MLNVHPATAGREHSVVHRGRTAGRLATLAAMTLIAGLSLTACSNSDSGSGSTSKALPKITFAEPTTFTTLSDAYVADVLGYFTKAGVDVTIKDFGANDPTAIIAGQADIGMTGLTATFSPSANGKQAKSIYAITNGPSAAGLYVKAGSPITSLMDLSGKKVAVAGVGAATYGAGSVYSAYIVKNGGKALQLVPTQNKGAQDNLLLSGQVDGSISAPSSEALLVQQGKASLLVDPQSSQGQSILGGITGDNAIASVGVWGMADWIDKNQDTTVKFLAAMQEADTYLTTHSVAEVVQVLLKEPLIKQAGLTEDQLTEEWTADQPYAGKTLGFISEQTWKNSLASFDSYGLKVNVSDPEFAYGTDCDMSYWNKAETLRKQVFGN